MKKVQLMNYKGKNVCLLLQNEKSICGIILQFLNDSIKIETDYGILAVENDKIVDINCVQQLKDLFVYTCKNIMLNCKGIRLISGKNKLNWPCKYFKKFQCQICKICNYNDIPLRIKNDFIDGMHSQIPVIGQLKK